MAAARRIDPKFVPRPWGSRTLAPWFSSSGERIGEVWFETPALLIKFLFATEPLSVQVHPGDEYARTHEGSNGKTEMWYLLRVEPGARIALGFREPVSKEQVRRAALDGSIEGLLAWHRVAPGDTFFTPAGTVHALGAGLTLLEIQQDSDVTYRLYDYRRGRELHLEKGLDVLNPGPHPGKSRPEPLTNGGAVLARSPYFVTELWTLDEQRKFPSGSVLILLEGSGRIAGQTFGPGQVWQLEEAAAVEPEGRVQVVRTYVPGN